MKTQIVYFSAKRVLATSALIILLIFSILLLSGCTRKPDLVISSIDVGNRPVHTAWVTVKNIGNADAGIFELFVDAEGAEPTHPIYKQASKTYSSLSAGASATFEINFDELPVTAGNNFNNVARINAHADGKKSVDESNETNNRRIVNIP